MVCLLNSLLCFCFWLETEKYKKANEKEWFFITERTKLCEGGKNNKRCVNGGYWKKTVTPEKINAGHGVVGYMSTLNFYVGKQPNGVRGDWLMQEYYFKSSPHSNKKVCMFTWVTSY